MKRSTILIVTTILFIAILGAILINNSKSTPKQNIQIDSLKTISEQTDKQEFGYQDYAKNAIHNISELRRSKFSGSSLTIESKLSAGSNFTSYIASYQSEGNKIYGLLTIPNETKSSKGFPAIVFMHGYIPPKEYSTTKNYTSYQAELASSGFVTYKPDLRGHGNSEGEPASTHFSQKYVIDALYAINALKNYEKTDSNRLGYWGHSNGGEIGLRLAVITSQIKAYSLWAGVVGSFEDMLETYIHKIPFLRKRDIKLINEHGLPSENPQFWNKIDPYNYLQYVSAPIQLQHGTGDPSVPVELSIRLRQELEIAGKTVELYKYKGDDHNISKNYNVAWQRTIEFFKNNL